MCSAVKVDPKVSLSKNVMALRFSACRESVDTLKQTALAWIDTEFFATGGGGGGGGMECATAGRLQHSSIASVSHLHFSFFFALPI